MVGITASSSSLRALVLALAFLVVPKASPAAPGPSSETRQFDGWQQESRYIQSDDGTRLAITVRRPTRGGQLTEDHLPVIVTQDRSERASVANMRRYTDHGYVWVAQDRRGTGASFGLQTGFVNEADARDAKAVIEWAHAQRFGNGRVVTMGCSNQGAWQYLVATLGARGLVAIAPACASPQFFDDAVSKNGIPMFPAAKTYYTGECPPEPRTPMPMDTVQPAPQPVDDDKDGALLKAAIAQHKCGAQMLGQYWANMPRDGFNDFARYRPALDDSAITHWQAVKASKVAILQMGGWYDAAVAGQLEGQRLWGGRLVMGPWVHVNHQGQGANLPAADVDLTAETLRWFDHYAKGVDNGADKRGVRYYTVNAPAGHEWHEVMDWAPVATTPLYLTDDSALSTLQPAATGARADYLPHDVQWFDGNYMPLARWFSGDMADSDAKSLVHTLAPFTRNIEVTGTITAKLWASADAPDVNVFAVIEDVDAAGKSSYVTDGRLRASWRKTVPLPTAGSSQVWHRGFAKDIVPLVPGRPELLTFDFFPTSYMFKVGHRLRVALTTTIGAAYQAPPLVRDRQVTLTLYRDVRHPSLIAVPMKPQ